jgi:hypothetical protein
VSFSMVVSREISARERQNVSVRRGFRTQMYRDGAKS